MEREGMKRYRGRGRRCIWDTKKTGRSKRVLCHPAPARAGTKECPYSKVSSIGNGVGGWVPCHLSHYQPG